MAKFGHKFATLADKRHMTPHDCLIYVARRVGEARLARDRAGWIGGRIVNRLTGSEPERVELSGRVLANSLIWLGESVPDEFPRGADLELRIDVAERLDQDLRAKAAVDGMRN
jgi:hypothetical protein